MGSNYSPRLGRWVVLLATPTLLTACGADTDGQTEEVAAVPVRTEQIQSGLRKNFTVTGEVTAEQSATVTAEFRADIVDIFVQPGDVVKQGQELLSMKSENVRARYSTANASYTTAAQNLQQTRITNRKNIESAKAALETAETSLQTLLVQNEQRRLQAEQSLQSAEVSLDLSVSSAETTLENAIRSSRVAAEDAIFEVDQILELRNDRDDLSNVKENHIGVRDPTFHYEVELALYGVYRTLDSAGRTYDEILLLLEETELVLEMSLTTLNNSITGVLYPESTHDANVRDVTRNLSAVRSAIASLQNAQRALETAKKNSGDRSQVIVDAEAQYKVTIAELDAAETNARRQVEQARIAYETAQASAGVAETGARSNLASVSGELQQARIENDKLTILAPFDGVVVDVPVRGGEEVNVGDILTIVENDSRLKIVAYISPSEARGVQAGDTVLLQESFFTTLSAVAPSADPITKKYKVEILETSEELKPGEFVRITFSTQSTEADARIFLPVTAVHVKASEVYVWATAESGSLLISQKVPVRLGVLEGQYVEIRSGVVEGDSIIVDGGRLIQRSGTYVRIPQDS